MRYETGDARPGGKAISKAEIENTNGFVTIRYETPCGCVMKRAMPAPGAWNKAIDFYLHKMRSKL